MTVCIGYLDNEGVAHIITDGMGSNMLSSTSSSLQKLHTTKDDNLLFAYAGRFDNEELQYYSFLPEPVFKKSEDDKYIKELPSVDKEYFYTELRYKLRDKFNKIRFHKEKDENKSLDSVSNPSLLLAHEGLLFEVQGNYELLPVEKCGYAIIGSGTWHGEGAMNLDNIIQKELPIKDRLINVLKAIDGSVLSVGKKYYYANTKDYNIEIIKEDNIGSKI